MQKRFNFYQEIMQKEINFYQEMASEHRLQEYSKGTVPLFTLKQKMAEL